MITTLIIRLLSGIVTGIFGLLPTWNINTQPLTDFTTSIGHFLGGLNGYVPEALTLVCLGILLAIKLALLIWRLILFLYELVPFN